MGGEVREHELQTICRTVPSFIQASDAVLFCGDFNLDMRGRNQEHVLKGEVPLSEVGAQTAAVQGLELPSSLRFETGFCRVESHGNATAAEGNHLELYWKTSDGSTKVLRNAFEGVDCLEAGPGPPPDSLWGSSPAGRRWRTHVWLVAQCGSGGDHRLCVGGLITFRSSGQLIASDLDAGWHARRLQPV